ncbi:MAG: amidohydrolase family protein [Myxococcales bacterium]|nr:amidohydrolase family protein [Myxococcales bacterium]MDD9970809.1 amidohydrolase family protein [Myxococcales bacterium]
MSYMQGRVAHDADSHVMEDREWLNAFIEKEFEGKLRPLFGKKRTPLDDQLDKAKARKTDPQADAKAADNPIAGPKGWLAYGAFDPDERKKVLDNLGFATQLVFPTAGLGPVMAARDDDERYAASRAYNRAIAAFSKGDKRLIPVAYVPLDDPGAALAGMKAALDDGCGAVSFSAAAPAGRSPGHPDYDPIWSLLSERSVPFMLHIGPGTKTQPKGFRNNGRERAPDLHGGGENLRFCDYMMLWYAPQVFLTAMVYDGVFMRFPQLRGGVIESGAGWVPDFLRQLDLAHKSFGRTDPYLQQLDMKPSEYIRRAVKFTPFPGEDVGHMIRDAGPELFLFSSDYPHPEGTKDPFGRFERTMDGIDEEAKEKFYRTNYEQMMGL